MVAHVTTPIDLLYPLVMCMGISLIIAIIGFAIYSCMALDKGRPILPWGARVKQEKAKATTVVEEERTKQHQQHLEQDAISYKKLALESKRTLLQKAIETEENIDLAKVFGVDPKQIDRY